MNMYIQYDENFTFAHYLTTSIEAAPDLKKSVLSSIFSTLDKILFHTTWTKKQ